jgi:subtilase family serine protease
MTHKLRLATLSTLTIALGAAFAGPKLASATPATAVIQASPTAAVPAQRVASTPEATPIEFQVGLQPRDPAGAEALARTVSDPASPGYRHYLSPSEWIGRFSPTHASVAAVGSWLRSQGFLVGDATADRMTLTVTGSAAAVERAFQTSLGQYRHGKQIVRLSSQALKVPVDIAPLISGITGVDQTIETPAGLSGAGEVRGANPTKAKASGPIPQPEGFRNAPPCSSSYSQKLDTTDPPFGSNYPSPLPYAVCGYTPPQLQGAYGLTPQIANGVNGKGVTVAVVDAYVSPTLFSDAHEYAKKNQPGQPLANGQFGEFVSKTFNHAETCEAPGWFGEQTLDVEAVHATAPGANILYVGAKNCEGALFTAVQQVIDSHLAQIVTDSWGDNGGDLLDSAGVRKAFDNVLLMGVGTGVSVQFSAGDGGDEFANLGANVADYPPSSPYQTAIGGTSLQIGAGNERVGELGWSTSKSVLCTETLVAVEYPGCTNPLIGGWVPPAPGKYIYGGGGGTSYQYPEPYYQQGVVPRALAERNSGTTGIANRVEPDVSAVGDPTTGMLVGETQTFPDGVYYDQYRIGGTSLSSPLFAGLVADADQVAGTSLGFLNPLLYKLGRSSATAKTAFLDVVAQGKQANVRTDYLDEVDAKEGTVTSVRTLDYQGREEFCDGTGHCSYETVALRTAPGFDSMTGLGAPGNGLISALAGG